MEAPLRYLAALFPHYFYLMDLLYQYYQYKNGKANVRFEGN